MTAARPLPLAALRAFDAVARMGSIRRAAADLGIGHASVVRHMRTLQDWCGRRLVESSRRGIELTEDGQALHQATAAALVQLRKADHEFGPKRELPALRLWCASGLAARWLAPKLGELEALLPGYQILIRPTEALPDFARGEADALIRYGTVDLPDIETTELDYPRMYPVASAEFIVRHGAPQSIEALARAPLIHEASSGQWRDWLDLAGLPNHASLPGVQLWQADLALEAAERGQGIALANDLLVRGPRSTGLVELLHTDIRLQPYVMVTPYRLRASPAIVALRRWLQAELGKDEAGALEAPPR